MEKIKVNNAEVNNAEVDNIVAEVNAENFIGQVEEKKIAKVINKPIKESTEKSVKLGSRCKVVNNKIMMSIAKNAGLMLATGVCGYLELMSPILYIPIELVCLCAVSFKCGEYKGMTKAKNA